MVRMLRHLFMPTWLVRRYFPCHALSAIERAIGLSELTHGGEVRFAVDAALDFSRLLRGMNARERALEVFSQLHIWDTEQNSGVLIYLLLAERNVEIIADRGINAKVGGAEWERICRMMELAFRAGSFEEGVLAGIREITALLALHFPVTGDNQNELPDKPVIL